jgi:hypothetical protein
MPSGSASSSARSSEAPTAPASPRCSCARASKSSASITDHVGLSARTEPSMTGASSSIARSALPSHNSIAAAVIRISARPRTCGSKPASAARTAAVSPIWICVRNARLRRSSVNGMLAQQRALDPLRDSHRRQRVLEPPLSQQQERPPVVQEQLRARGPTRRQRALRALQPSLRLREAPQPCERAASRGKGRGDLVMRVPSTRVGDRRGLLGQLAGEGDRQAVQRGGHAR